MRVCDHKNPITLAHLLESWAEVPNLNIPAEIGFTDSIQVTCKICGAELKASIIYTLLKPGKSRKTNRLWALLKGVA